MDFDTEAADDYYQAVKSWEDGLPCYLNRAGADESDYESDSGLLTPPPECKDEIEHAWMVPPPRPTYAESWIRVMKKRVEDGYASPSDQDSDASSVSSLSSDIVSSRYNNDYAVAADSFDYHCGSLAASDDALFSDNSIDRELIEGSTATAEDGEDLLAEMIRAYTVPKELKSTLLRSTSPKRKRSHQSSSKDKPSGVSKRNHRSLRSTRSYRSLKP